MSYENIKSWLKQEAQSSGDDYRGFLEDVFRAADELLIEVDEKKDWEHMNGWPISGADA